MICAIRKSTQMTDYGEPWFQDAVNPGIIRFTPKEEHTGILAGVKAKRIVACVNYCKDVPTEVLEEAVRLG